MLGLGPLDWRLSSRKGRDGTPRFATTSHGCFVASRRGSLRRCEKRLKGPTFEPRTASTDHVYWPFAERWLSGRKRPPAKWVRGVKLLLGFESRSLRQFFL